jgi:hypothetical protein
MTLVEAGIGAGAAANGKHPEFAQNTSLPEKRSAGL